MATNPTFRKRANRTSWSLVRSYPHPPNIASYVVLESISLADTKTLRDSGPHIKMETTVSAGVVSHTAGTLL